MAQHLIVVVDAEAEHWQVQTSSFINANTQNLTLSHIFSALKAFENALKLQHSENSISYYLALGKTSAQAKVDGCRVVSGSIWKAISKALCFVNRKKGKNRLLVIQKAVIEDEQEPALNLMIAAQGMKVEIDGLALSECESLAKTSAFTGGFYMRQGCVGVLQTLLQVYLPVVRPRAKNEDFLPYCNCCKKQVNKAFVCSVCLSLFCRYSPECESCGVRLILPDFF
jgi:hypothetical protein